MIISRPTMLALVLSCFCISLAAQKSPELVSKITISYGDDIGKLGSLGPGNDDWSPLFFAVLSDGSVAIPDYYKDRIAIFSVKGAFVKEIKLDSILSPRMNYFGVTGGGKYVVFNDSVLYCIAGNGTVLWNVPFPMGVFPQSIYASDTAVFFTVFDNDGKLSCISVSTEPPFESTDSTFRKDTTILPFVVSGAGTFGFTLSDTLQLRVLAGKKFTSPALPGTSRFLASDKADNSVWFTKDDSAYTVNILSENGSPIFTGSIPVADTSLWSWTGVAFTDAKPVLYLLQSADNAMVIHRYALSEK